MERDRNSSSVSSILSMGKEGPPSIRTPPNPMEAWLEEKQKLLANISQSTKQNVSVCVAIKNFKDALDRYPDCEEIRAEKAKYGLGPPDFLQTDTPNDPRDIKAALWSCFLRGHCHKNKQTKILIRVTSDKHFEVLKQKSFLKPDEAPVFVCAYHFTETNEPTGRKLSAIFLRHWFLHQTIPEDVSLRASVRSETAKPRQVSNVVKALWEFYRNGIFKDDLAIVKMKGANAP